MRNTAEDLEAAELLRRYENGPASRFVWDDLPAKAAYRTGGVVRRLCAWANRTCERDPLFALSIADAAITISAALRDRDFPRQSVHQLRGDAWKEQANALRFLGRFPEALQALDAAEAEYNALPVAGIGAVAVQYIRATVLYEQENLDAAERLAAEAAEAALHLGDVDRAMRARHLQGEIHFERGDFRAAARIFREIYEHGVTEDDQAWIARESLTLGNCHLELGQLSEAREYLRRARTSFAALRFAPEVTRTEWAQARLHFREGDVDSAVRSLRTSLAEFTRRDMLSDAGLVAVDLAEVLHADGQTAEIPALLAGVVETFTRAGKLNGALAAFAYLRAAAANGTINRAVVSDVRKFVARADRRPELQFVPPPL
jgi:tetratricopeptide (TPR) repeat protein